MINVTLTSTTNMVRKGQLYIESGVIKLSDGTFSHVLHEKAFNQEIREYMEPEIKLVAPDVIVKTSLTRTKVNKNKK